MLIDASSRAAATRFAIAYCGDLQKGNFTSKFRGLYCINSRTCGIHLLYVHGGREFGRKKELRSQFLISSAFEGSEDFIRRSDPEYVS